MVISERDADVLRNVRQIYSELQQLRKALKEQRDIALRSPSLDGMPRGGGNADRMTERLIRIESMEKREGILLRRLSAARMKAYRVCRKITVSVKARVFFEAYCADLQPVETAHKLSGVDDQTVLAYLKMLGEDK